MKLKYDEPVSNVAFNFYLRPSIKGELKGTLNLGLKESIGEAPFAIVQLFAHLVGQRRLIPRSLVDPKLTLHAFNA